MKKIMHYDANDDNTVIWQKKGFKYFSCSITKNNSFSIIFEMYSESKPCANSPLMHLAS